MISLEAPPAPSTKPKRKLSAGLIAYQAKQRALKAAGATKKPADVPTPSPTPKKAVATAKRKKSKAAKRSTTTTTSRSTSSRRFWL